MTKEHIIQILKDFQVLSDWESGMSVIKSDQFERLADEILKLNKLPIDEEIKKSHYDEWIKSKLS